MQEEYNKAYAEAIVVLNNSNKEILDRIPEKLIYFLYENMDKNYLVNINFQDEHWENTLMDETKGILGLIYRDYIVSAQQRNELLLEERNEQLKLENEIKEKYNPYNIFNKRKKPDINDQEEVDQSELMEIKKVSTFRKILNKICGIFKKK